MNELALKNIPTVELLKILKEAAVNNEQEFINMLAYELASRLYVPNTDINFQEMLDEFGYKEITKTKAKTR